MTDDLVARLLDWPYQGETMAHEAADRIEQLVATNKQLTAERDALGQDNHRWKMECENFWRDREKALTAERDRLREALEGLMAHEPDYSDTLWQDARTALKGETP